MDKFSELRAFAAVVEANGFSSAARELGQARSSVNRLVLALEERLGVQLLHRTTRRVSPTSNGQALYERARQLLDDLDEMEHSISAARTEAIGKLRISTPLSLGDLNFSDLVVAFMQKHPKVEIDITYESRFVDPVSEGFDVVIRVAAPDEGTALVDHRILELRYILCASPEYISRRDSLTVAHELSHHAILHQKQNYAKPSWTLETPDGLVTVAVSPCLTANNFETLLKAARAGLGVAIMPEYAIKSDLQAGRLVKVLPDHHPNPRMLQVIYPPARHLSARVRLFVDFVSSWCAQPDEAF